MNESRIAISMGIVLGVAMGCATSFAQCTYDWLPGDGVPGLSGGVAATTVWDPDGDGPEPEWLVVAGVIDVAGDVRVHDVAAWDGTTWRHSPPPAASTLYKR